MSAIKIKYNKLNGSDRILVAGRKQVNIVFYEIRKSKRQAITRERELKALNRKKLAALIKSVNPEMLDLSDLWNDSYLQNEQNSFF